MQQLNEIIDFYLKTNTNYALMITGEWGVGKTYYFKNILKKQIIETPTYANDQKKYRPILVSLFGLKSIEEIQTEIFLTLYPVLKNKVIKLGANIGKSLIKGIMHLKNLGDYYEYVSDVEVDKADWINLNELVLCFDDLERMSLNIEEFIGYVNSLVESENVKVLIIANENKIEKGNYFALKEKVIGNSIEFIPDLEISYDSLIEVRYSGFELYKKFLQENRDFILDLFIKKSSNLRILSFTLSYFQRIFSEIKNKLQSEDILKEKEDDILKILLKFSFAISIEYKAGNISYTKAEGIDKIGVFDLEKFSFSNFQLGNKKDKQDEEKTYKEKFIDQYFAGDRFYYFKSIYNFLTGGSILKSPDLINELKQFYNIQENKVLPQYEIFNQLNYSLVFSLSDKKYQELTKKMLEYSDKGEYDITNYLTVFHFAIRFGNPIKFNLDKLEKRVINGMTNGRPNYKYHSELGFYLSVDANAEYKDRLDRIRISSIELNKKIEAEYISADAKRLEELCYKDFEQFYSEVLSHQKSYFYKPLFQSFNLNKFYNFFIKSNNQDRWKIVRFWSSRYGQSPSKELQAEIDFLENMSIKIEKKISKIPKKGLTSFIMLEFDRVLKNAIIQLNAIS